MNPTDKSRAAIRAVRDGVRQYFAWHGALTERASGWTYWNVRRLLRVPDDYPHDKRYPRETP